MSPVFLVAVRRLIKLTLKIFVDFYSSSLLSCQGWTVRGIFNFAAKPNLDTMGQPSFSASNAIIYLTYGVFL